MTEIQKEKAFTELLLTKVRSEYELINPDLLI